MGMTLPLPLPLLFLFTFLLLSNPLPASSFSPFSFSNYHTLFSLSHSLLSRVANLRESRGDFNGAARARTIARKLDIGSGFGFMKVMWGIGWDFAKNYAWGGTSSSELVGALLELNEFLRGVSEISRVSSDKERVEWMHRNYDNLLRVSKSLFRRFRKVFSQSGPLKEVIETLQKEVVEGDLLKDCLVVGSSDLKGLLMVFRDISSKYTSTSSTRTEL